MNSCQKLMASIDEARRGVQRMSRATSSGDTRLHSRPSPTSSRNPLRVISFPQQGARLEVGPRRPGTLQRLDPYAIEDVPRDATFEAKGCLRVPEGTGHRSLDQSGAVGVPSVSRAARVTEPPVSVHSLREKT